MDKPLSHYFPDTANDGLAYLFRNIGNPVKDTYGSVVECG